MREIKKSAIKVVAMMLVLAVAFAYSPAFVKTSLAKRDRDKDVSTSEFKIKNKKALSSLKIGDRKQVDVSDTKGKLLYSSSNASVAKINHKGWVTAVFPGSATISVWIKDKPSSRRTCKVKVQRPVVKTFGFQSREYYYDFTEDEPDTPDTVEEPDEDPTEPGEPDPTEPEVPDVSDTPDDDNELIEWYDTDDTDNENAYRIISKPEEVPPELMYKYFLFTSSDPTVATVSKNGILTVLKHGETTITATLKSDKSKTSSMKIIVREPELDPEDEAEADDDVES